MTGGGRKVAAELGVCVLAAALLVLAATAEPWLERHFLPDWRISPAHQVLIFHLTRAAAAALALYLLAAVRPWLGRVVSQRPAAQLVAGAAPLIVAVLLSLGASELLLRQVPWLAREQQPPAREPSRRADPYLGWAYQPGRTGYDRTGGATVAYVFDALGNRVRASDRPVDPTRPTILFAGESIMSGHGMAWDETVPGRVEALTGVQSANLAVEGYANDQAYLHLRGEWPRYQRPVAVVTLFMPPLFSRMLDTDRPHLTPGLVWSPPAREWRLVSAVRRLVPYHSDAEIERGVLVAREVLRSTAAMASARGAVPLVVVPQFMPESAPEREIRRRVLDEAGVAYVMAPLDPAWRAPPSPGLLPHSRHPDARAARAISQAVVGYLRLHAPGLPPAVGRPGT